MALPTMTILEGVGDEVTVAGGVVFMGLALVLAWLSTYVADRGDHILGTILTAGAHVSLVSIGGRDAYMGGTSGSDSTEAQPPTPTVEDKPEDEGETGSEIGSPEQMPQSEGAADASIDHLLNIQGLRKRAASDSEPSAPLQEEPSQSSHCGVDVEDRQIKVRLKFLNDTEEVAVVMPDDTIGLLKSKYFSGQEQQIKLIYQGQLLQDQTRTLLSLNITDNSVIHCHVSQATREPVPDPVVAGEHGGVVLSMGNLMIPVFVVMLAIIWYFRINYRQFFTAPATVSLVGVTVFFSFLVFGMYSR
ncbi:transmembrane and ubiquitin-like domain-containing protein 2 [Amia ocellicauda]|uniref:transmembrane and ubiquitin-like domain-containing protein 2 n=1 Tax=Amia ocellicauda TaxID=2972642 RepID=UPI0034644913|nr:TMUB2 protein [Amia calva]